jgi:hypothetical protein
MRVAIRSAVRHSFIPRARKEHFQNLKRLILELEPDPVLTEFACGEVRIEWPEAYFQKGASRNVEALETAPRTGV